MAINKTMTDQTLYKRALSAEEKRRMEAISFPLTTQTGDQTKQNREQAYANAQTIKQLLQENRQQKAENSDAAAAQKTANLQNDSILKSGAQTQKNAALLRQPKTQTSGLTAAAPAELKDYTWWNWMGDNDMTTMTDEDKLSWQAAMAGWQKGDYSAYNDSFQKEGNWSSYVDADGAVSGMLRYVGDGVGGYVPVNGGQVLNFKQGDDLSGIAFYGPNGEVYTADSNGRLTRTGTWTRQEPYSALKESVPFKMLKGTATEEEREEWIKGMTPYEPEQKSPEQPKQTVPEKTAPARPADEDPQSGRRTPSSETPAAKPVPAPARQQPTGRSDSGIDWQSYLDAYDYGTAPEWEGTEYRQKRDAALEAAGQPWEPSEYQRLRDEALRSAGEPWQGSEYRQKRDEALRRAEDMRWSYDRESDPVWQALQKQYRREGQRASQDALGQYAAMTGGVPSSYAVTAASQAGDYYASQLSDRLPQLYQNAYERYLAEYQRQLGISDQYAQFDDTEYDRWADQQDRDLQKADRYDGYDQTEYSRYLDDRQQQLAAADRYQSYGAEDYDRYRDRLAQWNTDRAFRYGLNRDAVEDARYADETAYDRAWNEENRDYTRDYQARRDAISDQRYDQEWAQELREYADAQGWKALDWQQYLREYGDKLSQQEREWVYRQARDAESDRRYAQEYADEREQAAYQRSQAENERAYDRDRDALGDQRYDTQWQQSLREYEDEREQQAWNNAYKMLTTFGSIVTQDMADALGMPLGTTLEQYRAAAGYSGTGGSGRSSGSSKAEAEAEASGSRYDESGRRTGVWKDAEGYTYNGYHPDGQWKSRGYDAAWLSVQALAQTGAGKEKVLSKVGDLVEQNKITDYEAVMMLANLGYRTVSAGTGRNTIGPDNVQMVQ